MRRHPGILSSSMPSLLRLSAQPTTVPRLCRVTAYGTVMFGLASLVNEHFSSPRTSRRLHWYVVACCKSGIRHHRRTTVCSVCAISLRRCSLDVSALGDAGAHLLPSDLVSGGGEPMSRNLGTFSFSVLASGRFLAFFAVFTCCGVPAMW